MNLNNYFTESHKKYLDQYKSFLQNNPKKYFHLKDQKFSYIDCGKAEKILFIPAAGMGFIPAEYNFHSLGILAKNFRVITADPFPASSLENLAEVYNGILDQEGVKNCSVYGGSGAGMAAQFYFKQAYKRIDRMVLANTIAPSASRGNGFQLLLLRLYPPFLLKKAFKKSSAKLMEAEVPESKKNLLSFYNNLFSYMLDAYFTKPMMLAQMKLLKNMAAKGAYTREEFEDWSGKILIITNAGDPGYKDLAFMQERLPANQVHLFPKEMGHLTAFLAEDEYFGLIRDFILDRESK